MQDYKNLMVIGTSHISIQSIKEVENAIKKEKPDIIALELDKKRLYALLHKTKLSIYDIKKLGIKGFFLNLVGSYIEKKLGKIVNVAPGSEMKLAIKLAKKYRLNLALIDQDISITLKKLGSDITWKEKFRFIKEIIKSFIFRDSDVKIKLDLTKVPSKKLINTLIKKVREDYPNLYRVLIEERNVIMAKNLNRLIKNNSDKKILAIIGAGHEDEVIRLIKRA